MNDTLSTWEQRVEAAAQSLGITTADLEAKLAEMGIQNGLKMQMLEDDEVFKFGDFREAFKEKGIAVLRMAFKFLKGGTKTDERQPVDTRALQLRELGFRVKIDDADTGQLLALYLPDKTSDPVTNALRNRFGTKPVIAFGDDGKVAANETLEYVAGLEQGFPAQEAIMVGGKLAKLWPVGVKPDVMVDEDPLFAGVPLRNHISPTNSRNWSKVKLPARQLCRIIVDRGDIDADNRDAVLRLLERAACANEGMPLALTEAYPEAYLEYNERLKRDDLPKLRVALGSTAAKQHPFGIRRQY